MKLIPLTKGQFAKVADARYEGFSVYNWHARWNKKTQSYYAARNQNIAPPGEKWVNRCVWMHREILGLEYGDPRQGDHEDGDTLNNQDDNLRIATSSQNAMNRKTTVANTSGRKGVYFRPKAIANPWGSFIKINGKMIHLGFRATFDEACVLRAEAERTYFGEFATNR